MDNTKVGQLILQLRKEKGLTQQQLADRLNISNKAISEMGMWAWRPRCVPMGRTLGCIGG